MVISRRLSGIGLLLLLFVLQAFTLFVFPVGVIAGGALQVDAAHNAVHVQHHLAFTLAGQFPVAHLVSGP